MSKNQRLNASITIGSVLEQSVKKNIGFLKSGLHSVGAEIKEVEKRQRELSKQRKVLERQGRSVEALDREYEDLNRTMARLRRTQERWNRAAAASRRVGSTFSTMVSDIGRNSRALAIGVGLAGGAVFGLASSTAKLGDDVAKTADKLGIGIEQLQELRYAAERSGVSTSSFDQSLEKMTKNLGEASTGTGTAKDALEELGLSAEDLIKMSPEDALALIADRMEDVETQAEKAAIANDIFGRSGIGMLNMLRGGSKGLRDLRDDARRTGYVLSEQAARDAEVFQDTLLDTSLVMKGLKNTVGAELMPVVTDSMRRIGDALIGNREQVKIWSENFAGGVERTLPVLADLATGIGSVLRITGRAVGATADMVGGWENFGMIIGAVLASRTVVRIVKFGAAVFSLGRAMVALGAATPLVAGGIRAIGAALVANPIGALITAIALGAALIISNWDKIEPVLKPILDWLGKKMVWLWDNAGKPLIEGLKVGATAIGDAWATVESTLGAVLDWLTEKFEAVWARISPVIEGFKWVKAQGGAFLKGIGLGSDEPASGGLQTNASGGPFGPGWHLTGERGPELKFESRSGYVANNRAMRQLASFAAKGAANVPQGAKRALATMANGLEAAVSGAGPQPAYARASAGVTQHITNHFHASGVSAAELMEIAERRRRAQAQSGLFDRAPQSGPYGR